MAICSAAGSSPRFKTENFNNQVDANIVIIGSSVKTATENPDGS
jgi:hypothetical protein